MTLKIRVQKKIHLLSKFLVRYLRGYILKLELGLSIMRSGRLSLDLKDLLGSALQT